MALSRVSSLFITPSAKADLSDSETSTRSTVSSPAASPSMYRSASKGSSPAVCANSKRQPSGASEASTDNDFYDCDSSEETIGDSSSPSRSESCSNSDTESFSEPSGQQIDKPISRKPLEVAATVTTYPVAVPLHVRLDMGACPFPEDLVAYTTCPRDENVDTKKAGRAAVPEAKTVDTGPSWRAAKPTMHLSITPCGDSWAAVQQAKLQQRKAARTSGTKVDSTAVSLSNEDYARKVRSVLNKLTVERFNTLYEQLANAGASTPDHVAVLVREIFEISTSQHTFISMYANLCQRLESDSRIIKATLTTADTKAVTFRRILLDQCQTSFEEMLTGSPEVATESQDSAEAEEMNIRRKQHTLGNIKLTARLLVLDMLSSQLLITLCETLVDSCSTCPDALECLAALLTVAGPQFDTDTWLSHSAFEAIFEEVKSLTSNKIIPARMRFLLRDVLELRAARWVDKKAATGQSKGPMKLSDVRDEAASSPAQVARSCQQKASTWNDRPKAVGGAWTQSTWNNRATAGGSWNKSEQVGGTSPVSGRVAAVVGPSMARQPMPKSAAREPKVEALPIISTSKPAVDPVHYSRADFHRELWRTLRDLSKDGDVRCAAKRIEEQKVPVSDQASEFVDLITRAAEEDQTTRQYFFALAACLAEGAAFKRSACLEGVENFFLDVFDDLCDEVHDLAGIITRELIPALLKAVPQSELVAVVPPDMRP